MNTAASTPSWVSLAMLMLATSCGSPTTEDQSPSSGDIQTTQQALGELNCMWTAPDDTYELTFRTLYYDSYSQNENYDHSTCRHAWISQLVFDAPGLVDAYYDGPLADGHVYACNGMFVRMIVMRYSNGLWVTEYDKTAYGTGTGPCNQPDLPNYYAKSYTNYKVFTMAAYGNVYEPVDIFADFVPPFGPG